jgi:fructuronate reductase
MDDGTPYALRDPREAQIAAALAATGSDAAAISGALHGLPGVFAGKLTASAPWRRAVELILATMLERGMAEAIRIEAVGARPGRH